MIILNNDTRSLEAILSAPVTTNQLQYVVNYINQTPNYIDNSNSSNGLTNDGTAVTILAAPVPGGKRMAHAITIYNADTVSAIVTVRINDNSTYRNFVVTTLASGETLIYTSANGFYVIGTDGSIKSTATATTLSGLGDVTITSPISGNILSYNGSVWVNSAASAGAEVPTGAILDFGGTSAPSGYLGCDGAAVSRTTYATLFTAIGTTWGVGDGSTTFNVPNFQRKTSVGSGGSGTATLGNAVGNTGGEETHTLTVGELAAHTHTGPSHTHTGTTGTVSADHTHSGTTSGQSATHTHAQDTNTLTVAAGAFTGPGSDIAYARGGTTGVASGDHTHTITTGGISANHTHSFTSDAGGTGATGSTGSGTAHNVIQPSNIVLKIIKT